jgi:cell division protein FtsN
VALPLAPPVAAIPEPDTMTASPAAPDAEPATEGPSSPAAPRASSIPTTASVIVERPAEPSGRVVEGKSPRSTTYWVQVGAFRGVEAATRTAAALRAHAVTLVTTPGPSPLLRVLLGPFAHRADALLMLRILKGRGFEPFLAERLE